VKKLVRSAVEVIEVNRRGRPPEYHEGFCWIASQYTLIGGILDDIGQLLGTNSETVSAWMVSHPNFSEAIKTARQNADAEIEKSLFHRAKGYSHPAVKIFNNDGNALTVSYTEHYPPSEVACFFWLANRKPHMWKHRPENNQESPEDLRRVMRESLNEIDNSVPSDSPPPEE